MEKKSLGFFCNTTMATLAGSALLLMDRNIHLLMQWSLCSPSGSTCYHLLANISEIQVLDNQNWEDKERWKNCDSPWTKRRFLKHHLREL